MSDSELVTPMDSPTIPQLSPLSVGIQPDFMRRSMAELARDIVLKLDAPNKLAESYGLSQTQWAVLQIWPAFISALTNAKEELSGPAGVRERARRKAQLAVDEFVILDMARITGDAKASNRDKIAAAEVLIDIGGMGSRAQVAAATPSGAVTFGGPLINIVLPDGSSLGVAHTAINPLPTIEGEAKVVTKE